MHNTHQKGSILMNIENINKLYEGFISLQKLFEDTDAIDAVNGLRMASKEFRSAFFKVRESILKSPVTKQPTSSTTTSASTTPIESEPTKDEKEKEKATKKKKASNSNSVKDTKPKVKNKDMSDFDEFILNSYEEDVDSKIDIKTIIKDFANLKSIHLNQKGYAKYSEYLIKVFDHEGGFIFGIKPKLDPSIMRVTLDDITYHKHPKYNIWVSDEGNFYNIFPDGKTIKEIPKRITSMAIYVYLPGGKNNLSARKIAFECYLGKEVSKHIACLNGNKEDLREKNLAISEMPNYTAPKVKYYPDDVVRCCEYIVSHNKDISNIETDTNYEIGYNFAKNILNKKSHTKISDKYF